MRCSVRQWLAALAAALCLGSSPAWAVNYSDIWWNPAESGWGITIADHDTNLFAVLYAYRQDGRPVWYTIPGGTWSNDRRFFSGDVYMTRGPSYGDAAFDSSRVVATKVGSATFDFSPAAGAALLSYTIDGVSNSKQIQRQSFGSAAPMWGSDFTDLWFNPHESGWGISLAQHGNNLFGVWYTYDADGEPLWLVMPGVNFTSASAFTGKLYTTTGPYFGAASFDPAAVSVTEVGDGSFSLSLNKAELCQGATLTWAPVITRAPLGTVRQTRLVCPQPFGNANTIAGTQQPPPVRTPKTCTGLYSASVKVPATCTVGAGTQKAFNGSMVITGIDWTFPGRQVGVMRISHFLATLESSAIVIDQGQVVSKPCDQPLYTDFDDADVTFNMGTDALGTMVGTGTIDIGMPWNSEVDFRVPGGITVSGNFSYSYRDVDFYEGSGSFSCQFPR